MSEAHAPSQQAHTPPVDITAWPAAPMLDWYAISFHTPVPNWAGLQPNSRIVQQMLYQQTGGVPLDHP
jgi:hypothetical protein